MTYIENEADRAFREAFEERAAILEYEAEIPRERANVLALEMTRKWFADQERSR